MQYNDIMQDIAFYDMDGLLSEAVRETVCDIVCSIEPSVYLVDYIDLDGIIKAVDEYGATDLDDVYDIRFDGQLLDWYYIEDFYEKPKRVYLNIGNVTKRQACSFMARLGCDDSYVKVICFPSHRDKTFIRYVIVRDVATDNVVERYQI